MLSPHSGVILLLPLACVALHLCQVKAPTLMILGAKDRRVPPSNGLQVRGKKLVVGANNLLRFKLK